MVHIGPVPRGIVSLALSLPLQDFDFSLLDSSGFKEDSVREEISLPILNALGYEASGAKRGRLKLVIE